MRFFQFGCWNNLNEKKGKVVGGLKRVMAKLKTTIETSRPEFIVVSGDNYYPGKSKEAGSKKKTVDFDKLREGFVDLPSDINIHMLLGNHDLETQTQPEKPKLFIKDEERPENGSCEILRKEKSFVGDKRNIHYNSFTSIVEGDTLILMMDTSMYEDDKDVEKYLPCYNVFFSPNPYFTDVKGLREYQLQQITEILDKIKTDQKHINHIILIGHHPIYCYKTKEKEDEQSGAKQSKFESDIIHNFRPVLQHIYSKVTNCEYYYLCSDLHLYQTGNIQLTFPSSKPMVIQQYIVGNGGTELDKKSDYDYTTPNIHTFDDGDTYLCTMEEEKHGFLECVIDTTGPTFIPHFVEGTSGGKKRKTNTKNKEKNTKTRRKTQRRRRNHISSISRRTTHVQ
jgi:predicted MPP superfamily phosphohydrolase